MPALLNIFRVTGPSMEPRLSDGDYVITTGVKCLTPGCIVVIRHPEYQIMIKRVIEIREQGEFLLAGENNLSITSEQIGWCSREWLLGVVLITFR